jgi:hypothetical protein
MITGWMLSAPSLFFTEIDVTFPPATGVLVAPAPAVLWKTTQLLLPAHGPDVLGVRA